MTGTTAASTGFAFREIRGPDGRSLWLDGNAKITGLDGTFTEPAANAFSLLQISDCPFSTGVCRSACYVHNLEEHQPEVHAKFAHNSRTLREILMDLGGAAAWSATLAEAIQGLRAFRWHVSGDVFSPDHAAFIVMVCLQSPGTVHWIYTRSFQFVPRLLMAPNLKVNLSADRENLAAARATAETFGLRLCYMSTGPDDVFEPRPGDVLFPDYSLRGDQDWWESLTPEQRRAICPVDYFGKSPSIRCGICRKCMR